MLVCVSMILSTSCGLGGLLRASRAKVSSALESASLSEATAAPALVQFRPGTGGSVSPRAGIEAAARVVTATTSPAAVTARAIFARMFILACDDPSIFSAWQRQLLRPSNARWRGSRSVQCPGDEAAPPNARIHA
jgi:hypothetical protein